MSLLREIMDESRGEINDILGHAATLTNTATTETQPVQVVINTKVKLYDSDSVFVGLVTTAVFDRTACDPKIDDTLLDDVTGIEYTLAGIKSETPSKLEFILGEN